LQINLSIINNFRAVRAMNETLKQNRLLMEQGDDRLFTNNLGDKDNGTDLQKNVSIFLVKWIHILMFFSDIKTFP